MGISHLDICLLGQKFGWTTVPRTNVHTGGNAIPLIKRSNMDMKYSLMSGFVPEKSSQCFPILFFRCEMCYLIDSLGLKNFVVDL